MLPALFSPSATRAGRGVARGGPNGASPLQWRTRTQKTKAELEEVQAQLALLREEYEALQVASANDKAQLTLLREEHEALQDASADDKAELAVLREEFPNVLGMNKRLNKAIKVAEAQIKLLQGENQKLRDGKMSLEQEEEEVTSRRASANAKTTRPASKATNYVLSEEQLAKVRKKQLDTGIQDLTAKVLLTGPGVRKVKEGTLLAVLYAMYLDYFEVYKTKLHEKLLYDSCQEFKAKAKEMFLADPEARNVKEEKLLEVFDLLEAKVAETLRYAADVDELDELLSLCECESCKNICKNIHLVNRFAVSFQVEAGGDHAPGLAGPNVLLPENARHAVIRHLRAVKADMSKLPVSLKLLEPWVDSDELKSYKDRGDEGLKALLLLMRDELPLRWPEQSYFVCQCDVCNNDDLEHAFETSWWVTDSDVASGFGTHVYGNGMPAVSIVQVLSHLHEAGADLSKLPEELRRDLKLE